MGGLYDGGCSRTSAISQILEMDDIFSRMGDITALKRHSLEKRNGRHARLAALTIGKCATTAQNGGHYGHLMLCTTAQEKRVWPLGAGLQEQASTSGRTLTAEIKVGKCRIIEFFIPRYIWS